MIRVLHYGLSTNTGGIETYIQKLMNNINKLEYHFDFIDETLDKPSFHDEFIELGSKFYKITPRSKSLSKNKKDLQRLFEEESFDIFHCHLNTLSYIEPVLTALKSGCKVIVHSRSAGSAKSIKTNVLHYYHSIILPKHKIKMVAVSDLAGKWLFGKNAPYETINNGIEVDKFKYSNQKREKIRSDLKIKDNFVLGNVGAFLPVKNHKLIIKIFYELLKKKPNAVLLLIGKGPMYEEIVNLVNELGIEDKVLFLGRRVDIPDLLSAMDFFLFPSLFEGFPNAVLEAQCSGLPCVISDRITEEVILGEDCLPLSLDLKPAEWASKIITIYKKDKDRMIGKYIVNKAGFSVQEEIKKIESMYFKLKNN